ncbi:hypothetical protein BD413DRAFT_614614 [Trametes elegans]|nr:hypothetical protein BD413DRAFT_614614 [Trametes elegans]
MGATKLSDVFHHDALTEGVDNFIRTFDFSRMNVRDSSRQDHLHFDLAPAFGSLTADSLKRMDRELKLMITSTMDALKEKRQRTYGSLDWDDIMAAMNGNRMIEPFGWSANKRDKLIKEGTNFFKFDGSPDSAVVHEVNSWFVNFINDGEVLDSTRIDINVMGKIVAQTGATVTGVDTLFYKKEEHSKTIVDIGVLRFPDVDRPYFKACSTPTVFRIKLVAWSSSERVLFVQDDKNGIFGEYNMQRFRPRQSVMRGLSDDVLDAAAREAEELLCDDPSSGIGPSPEERRRAEAIAQINALFG